MLCRQLSRQLVRTLQVFPTSSSQQLRKMSSEEQKAKEAKEAKEAVPTSAEEETIFGKIIKGQIPADIVYQDEQVMAFRDLQPQAPVHVLIVPKKRINSLDSAQDEDKDVLGSLLLAAKKVAAQEKLSKGYRVVINNGPEGCQSVYHLHLHVIGGRQMRWPPG